MLGARTQLEYGIHCERNGFLWRAIESYQSVAATADEPAITAEALRRQADAHRLHCDWERALDAARRSAVLATKSGLPELFAEALNAEAAVYQAQGDFITATPLFEQALSMTGDDRIRGNVLQNLGSIAALSRDLLVAAEHFGESKRCFQRAGDRRGEIIALNNCAALANIRADHDHARALAEEAMTAARSLGDFEALAYASLNYAEAVLGTGDLQHAEEMASTAFGYFSIEENMAGQVGALRLLGDLNRKLGNAISARRAYEHGLRLARLIGARIEESLLTERLAELEDPPSDPAPA